MPLSKKMWLTAFAGVSALYGDDTAEESVSFYPAGGVGVYYVLNDEKVVVRADYAIGTEGNRGFYLQFGHPFEK